MEDVGGVVKSVETQLVDWKKTNKDNNYIARNLDGIPIPSIATSLTLGECGPVLMQDDNTLQFIQDFNRQNPPERVIHPKGVGAYGIFKVTDDITDLTCAKIFSEVGKETPLFSRMSSSNVRHGPDGAFSMVASFKFYTEDGNWDLLTRNRNPFIINDPILFVSQNHITDFNPTINVLVNYYFECDLQRDGNMLWDYFTKVPETLGNTLATFSDYGRPKTFRKAFFSSINTFKLINTQGKQVYAKWTVQTNQGYDYLTDEDELKYRKTDPDFQTRDLFNAIAQGDFPSWTLFLQTQTEEQVANFGNKKTGAKWNPFDVTLRWPPEDYPYRKVGVLTLNKNLENDFNETEQSAFCPARLVPGIEAPLQDINLQGRVFAYPDAQAYRTGINNQQLEVNRPQGIREGKPHTYERDGFMNGDTTNKGAPNYYPNSFDGPIVKESETNNTQMGTVRGKLERLENLREERDFYTQPGDFFNSLTRPEKQRLVKRIAESATGIEEFLKERVIAQMSRVDPKFGKMLREVMKRQQQGQNRSQENEIKVDETQSKQV